MTFPADRSTAPLVTMFRLHVAAPRGFRPNDEATRALGEFGRALQASGWRIERHGLSLAFSGLIRRRGSNYGRGTVTWVDGDATRGGRFVLRGSVWVELLAILAIGAVVALFPRGGFRLDEFLVVTGIMEAALIAAAFARMLWLRGRLAALVDAVRTGSAEATAVGQSPSATE